MADRTGNTVVVAFAQRLVTISDFAFTATGAVMAYIAGKFFLVEAYGGANEQSLLVWGHGLFVLSGVIWLAVLIPVQVKKTRLAAAFNERQAIPESYKKLSFIWASVGIFAAVLPLLALIL